MQPRSRERVAELEREAREHKRSVRFHRERLRECMQELSELRAVCARVGIQVTTGEGETHGQGTTRASNRQRS